MSIIVDRGSTWALTLDRPERANALSAHLVESLHGVLDEADAAGPDALVLRGNPRHFAAGFDLGGLAAETDATLALRFLRIGDLLERLIAAPYVTAAVVDGAAVGAGADLVLACDHRLVDPSVTLRFPGSSFGVALGGVRRAELGGRLTTGVPSDLAVALAGPRPDRPQHDSDAEVSALARSVSLPGLHARLTTYADQTMKARARKKEPA
ncbi:enoyl-CoA hydratase/isomerase family protein [Nocardioides KLBMP 9356]|uniref:Enoyl-CoA hydratase/isomerase family protein n=1 Tax=Nocardioides potassii TaxID=2911371 RepID=A0ABS9HC97_9ACTN|nr:enoyl-CoA hydratase/isomerase family protein [Nocardioides potassii]MCF6377922.1 enoyl-CoA hydratase/isomerase family protein [Nocardioides potassii]